MSHFNPDAPHQVVILVRYENYERDEQGRCVGRPSTSDSKTFTFFGKDHAEAEQQAQDFMRRIQNAEQVDSCQAE